MKRIYLCYACGAVTTRIGWEDRLPGVALCCPSPDLRYWVPIYASWGQQAF